MAMTRAGAFAILKLAESANAEEIKSTYTNLVLALQTDKPLTKREVQSFIQYTMAFHTLTKPYSNAENDEPVFSCFTRPIEFSVPQIKPLFDRCASLAFHYKLMERQKFSLSYSYVGAAHVGEVATKTITFSSARKLENKINFRSKLISIHFSEMAFPRHWLKIILDSLYNHNYNHYYDYYGNNGLLEKITFPEDYPVNEAENDFVKKILHTEEAEIPHDLSGIFPGGLIGFIVGVLAIAAFISNPLAGPVILGGSSGLMGGIVGAILGAISCDRIVRATEKSQRAEQRSGWERISQPSQDNEPEGVVYDLTEKPNQKWLPAFKKADIKQASSETYTDNPYESYDPRAEHDHLLNASLRNRESKHEYRRVAL